MTAISPRQTLSYLQSLFEARGLRPKTKLGQCFLIDLNLLELIIRTAQLSKHDLVLEVGSGSGSLTARLAQEAGAVLGVEIDAGFYELARESTAAFTNVFLLRADILERKNTLNPEVVQKLVALHTRFETRRMKLVANLPYVVATPVIMNLLLTDLPFERMVVTTQWELAERLIAKPSTKDYGALSVLVQSVADVELLRRMPPHAFWPRPKVDSGLVKIVPNAQKRASIEDLPSFHEFLRSLYLHRRKNLRGTLVLTDLAHGLEKPELDALLQANSFDPLGRAEALTVEQHQQLWRVLKQARPAEPK